MPYYYKIASATDFTINKKITFFKALLVHLPQKHISQNLFLYSCIKTSCILHIWCQNDGVRDQKIFQYQFSHIKPRNLNEKSRHVCANERDYDLMSANAKPQHILQCKHHFCIEYLLFYFFLILEVGDNLLTIK